MMNIDKVLKEAYANRVEKPVNSSLSSRESGVKRIRGLRVLVIDGGGSKGIVAATILKQLEDLLSTNGEPVFLADHFDLIAGTSAGGMISFAHAHGRIRLSDIITLFASGKAFTKNVFNYFSIGGGFFGGSATYSGENLEKLLKIVLPGDDPADGGKEGRILRKEERNDLKPNPESKRPRVFALSSPASSLKAGILFTNYPRDEYIRAAVDDTTKTPLICSSVSPWQAARATSAAPTYFPEAKIPIKEDKNQVHCFWDGGLVNNSPILEAITQAHMLFGYDRGFDLVLSIGCGNFENHRGQSGLPGLTEDSLSQNFKRQGKSLREAILDAVTNSEKEFQSAKENLKANPMTKRMAFDRIFRLNPDFTKIVFKDSNRRLKDFKVDMDTTSTTILEAAQKATEEWCQNNIQEQLKEIAQILFPDTEDGNNDLDIYNSAPDAEIFGNSSQGTMSDEYVRIKALRCTTHFFPPLVRLSKEEKESEYQLKDRDIFGKYPEANDTNGKDAEKIVMEHAVVWKEKLVKSVVPILKFIENSGLTASDQAAKTWIQMKSSNQVDIYGLANDIERCRFTLWRCFISRMMKYVDILQSDKLKLLFISTIGIENLLKIEKIVLRLDKANALYHMKIDRRRPFCPKGFAWITKDDLKSLSTGLKLQIGYQEQRYSIDPAHESLYDLVVSSQSVSEASSQILRDLLLPELPQWMAGFETVDNNRDFQTFYQNWTQRFN